MMEFDVLVCSHGESLDQLEALVFATISQKTREFKLGRIILCSDDRKLRNLEDYSSVTFIEQPSRLGKPDALNRLLKVSKSEIAVQESADTLPASEYTFYHLLLPFKDATVGAVTSRPEPVNDGFLRLPRIVWKCHHFVQPKVTGELFAFRRELVDAIPNDIIHDDTYIHRIISTKGYGVVYEPKSVVLNRVPESLGEFYLQRKKNVIGNLQIMERFGDLPTDKTRLRSMVLMSLELLANLHGKLDYVRGKIPKGLVGYCLESTKNVNDEYSTCKIESE
jgi:cellulose synthase/poly-beta-1,6-N-acetylglucosamine synthase-like glycosyltransferase